MKTQKNMEKHDAEGRPNRNPANERMSQVIHFFDGSLQAFAIRIGKAKQTVNTYMHVKGMSKKLLETIIKHYPQVNPEWIITGNGCPFKECDNKDKIKREEETIKRLEDIIRQQGEMINQQQEAIKNLMEINRPTKL